MYYVNNRRNRRELDFELMKSEALPKDMIFFEHRNAQLRDALINHKRKY